MLPWLVPAQVFPTDQLFYGALSLVLSALAAWWVYSDSRARLGGRWDDWVWVAGTFIAAMVFLPVYLLAVRPPGRVTRCPHCGAVSLSHRAACVRCGGTLAFDARPEMWGLGEIVGISTLFGLTLPFIAGLLGVGGRFTLVGFTSYAVAQSTLIALLATYVVRVRYRQPLTALGWRRDHAPFLAVAGAALGLIAIPLSTASEFVGLQLIGAFVGQERAQMMAEVEHTGNPVTALILSHHRPTDLLVILLVLSVLVPIAEETFFRGFVYRALRERWGLTVGLVGSALFFGAVHLELVHFFPIFVLGLVLAYSYERTGSIVPAAIVHAVNNLVAVLSVLYGWNI